jgi:sugar lactone lactonase YvrE
MKKLFAACLLVIISQCNFAQHQLVKLWETDSVLKVPESVLYSGKDKILYVTNIDGKDPWGKDGAGSIAKVALDGKVIAAEWVKGLHAPKGMALVKGLLFVADLEELKVISTKRGTIIKTIAVAGAQGLNDVTADARGIIYVSDSKAKKVYRVENDNATLFLENLKGPNGVLWHNGTLFVLDAGGMYSVGADKSLKLITDGMEGNTDGLEHLSGNKEYIVSCWAGQLFYVNINGTKENLSDTRNAKINSADIGINAAKRIIYVPTFWRNTVIAYEIK